MKGVASNFSRRDWGLARGLAVACYERGSVVSENHVKPVTITRTNIIEPRALYALWSLKVTLLDLSVSQGIQEGLFPWCGGLALI